MNRQYHVRMCFSALAAVCLAFPSGAESPDTGTIGLLRDGGSTYLTVDGGVKYMIVEGDILVPVPSTRGCYDGDLWGDGEVHYEFSANVPSAKRQIMLGVFAELEGRVDVGFTAGCSPLGDCITIHSTDPSDCATCECVNSSTVGETFQGDVYICDWVLKTIRHELGHTLNLWHTQSRADRGNYVHIHYDRIPSDEEHNFDIHGSYYGPYDFDSRMHYTQCAFSMCGKVACESDPSNCRTITVLPPNEAYQTVIGEGLDYSDSDWLMLGFLYPWPDWRFVDADCEPAGCGVGGFHFFNPECEFPDGVYWTPEHGTLWVQPGDYDAVGVYDKAMMIRAPLGGVRLGDFDQVCLP